MFNNNHKDMQKTKRTGPILYKIGAVFEYHGEEITITEENQKQYPHPISATYEELEKGIVDISDAFTGPNAHGILMRADLRHVDFTKVNCYKAHFGNADLTGANLAGKELNVKNLSINCNGAILKDANLSFSVLNGAYFYSADMENANLINADLRGAAFSRSGGNLANLTGAFYDDRTILDDALTAEQLKVMIKK